MFGPSTYKPERAYKTFTTYLKQASTRPMTVERAISKITGLPSRIFNIDGRGFISDGYFADLVLLTKDFDVSMVMVNGLISVENGLITTTKGFGRLLKKNKK